jgi:hypothetical protein
MKRIKRTKGELLFADSMSLPFNSLDRNPGTDVLRFRCNICGKENRSKIKDLTREKPSCKKCGSNVRLRSLIHLLSIELFGESIPLTDFPEDKNVVGIGMSDCNEYAKRLAKKLNYTNTFFHKQPMLDIQNIGTEHYGKHDFVISSEVFEHIEPPVSRAFINLKKMLREGGFVIFSVPFIYEAPETIEHFPELHTYSIDNNKGNRTVRNITKNGAVQTFENAVFHGGNDTSIAQRFNKIISHRESVTLEMRLFTKNSLIREFRDAGFTDLKFFDEEELRWGIVWTHHFSFPIVAR